MIIYASWFSFLQNCALQSVWCLLKITKITWKKKKNEKQIFVENVFVNFVLYIVCLLCFTQSRAITFPLNLHNCRQMNWKYNSENLAFWKRVHEWFSTKNWMNKIIIKKKKKKCKILPMDFHFSVINWFPYVVLYT